MRMRILVIAAHAADPFWWCGGTLAKHTSRGDEVLIAALSYGENSHAAALWEEARQNGRISDIESVRNKIKSLKRIELEKAAKIIGAHVTALDYGDSPLVFSQDRLRTLVELVRTFKPTVVLLPWSKDANNKDHETGSELGWQACHYARDAGFVTGHEPYEVQYIYYHPSAATDLGRETGFIADIYIDITKRINTKIKALAQFKSQGLTQETAKAFCETQPRVRGYQVERFKTLWDLPMDYLGR